jgi:hypothetical protein
MEQLHTSDYYRSVFHNLARVLRIFHRELKFGHITMHLDRSQVNIRWSVRKKGFKKFTYDTPITFDSISNVEPIEIVQIAESLIQTILVQLPNELRPNQ